MSEVVSLSPMSSYYDGKTIFLTGGSGFLGQLYVQKLLRSKISTLYLFLRPKRGQSTTERQRKLFDNPVFDKLKLDVPNFLDKIRVIEGSLNLPGLGIQEVDKKDILDKVELVIHAAADVRFNRSLIELVKVNLNGTRELLILSRQMQKLRLFTYISTCYSNCILKTVEERIYDPPIDPDLLTELAEKYSCGGESQEIFELLTTRFIHPWPNTYTFSKAMSESVVESFKEDIPICVVRPAIVLPAYTDPVPGWVSNYFGFVGLIYSIGLGIFRVCCINDSNILDFTCADLVTNSTLAAIWSMDDEQFKKKKKPELTVFSVASGRSNPVSFKKFQECSEYAKHIPISQSIWHPVFIIINNRIIYFLLHLLLEIIPAVLLDIYFKCTGSTITLLPLYRIITFNILSVLYFVNRQWTFMDDNMISVYVKMTEFDKKLFPSDVRVIDWKNYFYDMCHGIRKYLHKDQTDWTSAFRRASYLYIIHIVTKFLFIGLCGSVIYLMCKGGYLTNFFS